MLKDGKDSVKSVAIRKYIQYINQYINEYANILGFNIEFEFDEKFDESMPSSLYSKLSYDSFSEGRKARLDLSILFAWIKIAQLKNTVSTNLLIMDEVLDGSLDADGVECVTRLLSSFSDKNIFVISHSPENYRDLFDDEIQFEIKNQFSEIAQ
jgi:ABC-type multidrug transport system ATPase subunit